MKQDEKLKAAIYCRLSDEDRNKANPDDDSESIANQKVMLTRYCNENDFEIYGIYSDDNYTGCDRERPEFNRMIADAKDKKFDIILCKSQSRFSRETEITEKYINYKFINWGIRFIAMVDNIDTDNPSCRKLSQLVGMINQWYLEDMSDSITASLNSKRSAGKFIGAFAPFGYKKDPDKKGHLIVDDDAADIVKQIFSLYISGLGRTAIARELNRLHIPTPTDYKIANGERYKNNYTAVHDHLWRYYMIGRILTDEVYIGHMIQGKVHKVTYKSKLTKPVPKSEWIKVKNTHEPIIDMYTWDMAQNILASRTKPSFKSDFKNIFSKKVFCAECGRAGRMHSKGGNKENGRYLRCGTKYYAPKECKGFNISYNKLYNMVLEEFKAITAQMLDEESVSSMVTIQNSRQKKLENYQSKLAKIKNEVEETNKYFEKMYEDRLNDVLDAESFVYFQKKYKEKKENNIKECQRLEEEISVIKYEIEHSISKLELIRQYADFESLTFEMVQIFIDKIVVHHKERYSREDNIEIFWNF